MPLAARLRPYDKALHAGLQAPGHVLYLPGCCMGSADLLVVFFWKGGQLSLLWPVGSSVTLPELDSITNPLLIAPSAVGVRGAMSEHPVKTGMKGRMYNHTPGVYYPFLYMDVERREVKGWQSVWGSRCLPPQMRPCCLGTQGRQCCSGRRSPSLEPQRR